jgi:hypothetical protein
MNVGSNLNARSFGKISVKCATVCVFEDIDFGKWPKKLVEAARVNWRAAGPIPTSTLLRILNSVLPLRDSTFSPKKYDPIRKAFALFTVFGGSP